MRDASIIYSFYKYIVVDKNFYINFKMVKKKHILKTYPITSDDFQLLLKMSPMYNDKVFNIPKTITIDLMIYIMNGEEL